MLLQQLLKILGQGVFVDDLKPEIKSFGPILGKELTNRMITLSGGGDKIEAYGKACMSGLDCEIEYLLH